jgi:hypothetical protein
MANHTQHQTQNYIDRLPAELTLHIASYLSEQHAFGSLLNFASATRSNWQRLSDELYKTILIKSDRTIAALLAADVVSGNPTSMPRWKAATTVVVDYIPSPKLSKILDPLEGSYSNEVFKKQPLLPSVKQVEVTTRCLNQYPVYPHYSRGVARYRAESGVWSLGAVFGLQNQFCFDSKVPNSMPLDSVERSVPRAWEYYIMDTDGMTSSPRCAVIHGLSMGIETLKHPNKCTRLVSLDKLEKSGCIEKAQNLQDEGHAGSPASLGSWAPAYICSVKDTVRTLVKSFNLYETYDFTNQETISYKVMFDTLGEELSTQVPDILIKLQGIPACTISAFQDGLQEAFYIQVPAMRDPDWTTAGRLHTVKVTSADKGDICSICQRF